MALAWRQTRRRYMVLALALSIAFVRRPRPAFSELCNIRLVCLVVVESLVGRMRTRLEKSCSIQALVRASYQTATN